jgi:glycosyltransferase involved in cell wall biosynthesis
MKVSLIVTTYDRPDALKRVLDSVVGQSRVPDETIVVDDGSDERTAAVVESSAGRLGELRHLWQENRGFRPARMRNMGVAEADGDYILLIDGDMVLHPQFVADHAAAARRGCFLQGVRIPLHRQATENYLAKPFAVGPQHLERPEKAKYLLRSPGLSRWIDRRPLSRLTRIHSCNQSFWRDDLLTVNGFDERLNGYGGEDVDLCSRLLTIGVSELRLRFAGLAYHLYHPPGANWREFRTLEHAGPRARIGIDQYLPVILPFPSQATDVTRVKRAA